jgi:tetratricopeptide (TPR) repeat protein
MDQATVRALIEFAEAARARSRAGEEAEAIAGLEARDGAIQEALAWCLDHDRIEDGLRLAGALVGYWRATGRVDDGDAWFGRALLAAGAPDAARARALYDHGYLVFWAGRYELAEDRFTEARALATDPNVVALALAGSARVALRDDPSEAVRLLREALDVTRDLPGSDGRSSADHVLGVALQMAGDLAGARDVMTERLERARAAGNALAVMSESGNLSMVERQLGNLDRAEAFSREALRIVIDQGDEMALPWILNGLAAVTAAQGHLERAATLHGIAAGLLERAGGEWPPDEREQFDGTLATLEQRMDPERLASARDRGASMTVDEAVAYARD